MYKSHRKRELLEQICVYLPHDVVSDLWSVAELNGYNLSHLVRMILIDFLESLDD